MTERFGTRAWSLQVPAGWTARHDEECATLVDDAQIGALQLSAMFKEGAVTDEDLRDFASEHLDAGAVAVPARCGDFVGFEIAYGDGERAWRVWYLRDRATMLFVTYNCAPGDRGDGDAAVDEALSTLAATRDDGA